MYGAQTALVVALPIFSFENDVEMYGAQTIDIVNIDKQAV